MRYTINSLMGNSNVASSVRGDYARTIVTAVNADDTGQVRKSDETNFRPQVATPGPAPAGP